MKLKYLKQLDKLCIHFYVPNQHISTLLPKSITTAIGMGISEEMGGIVAICVILVCLSCFMQMMMMGMDMESLFYKLICIGLSVIYVMQVFLTIGGAIKFIPSTGVTLPFVSYGGSSMISSCILFAIFQSLFVIQGKEDAMDEEEEEQQAPKGKRRRTIYE